MTWTKELTDIVRVMAASGSFASQIAAEIGTTKNSVIGKARREGIYLCGGRRTAKKLTRRVRLYKRKKLLTLIEKSPAFTSPQYVTIEEVTGCRYPFGNKAPYLFCNASPVIEGTSYCQAHCRICYQPVRRKV